MNVAFIPVRGGSRSIPLKNIKYINGRPLVYWALKAACECTYIDTVYVATDSEKISETIEKFKKGIEAKLFAKVEIISRSAESASDTASTEFAMLEFAAKYEFDNIVLIQATSPLLQASDLHKGFETFYERNTDSVLSVVRQKRFYWKNDDNGFSYSINYDVFHRPRRQDFDGYLVENGAFYITSKINLIKFQNRVSGNIKTVEMSEDTFFEIDEPNDWMIVEMLMKKNGISAPRNIPEIKMFLTDCDGCLTDGGMYYSEYGDELKKFNTHDGMAFQLLRSKGILTGIITGENRDLNRRRVEKLNIDIYISGCTDKFSEVKKLSKNYNIPLNNILYVGDDLNDLKVLKNIGFGCCPANAVEDVRNTADFITSVKGGNGVIREIVDEFL